MNSVPTLAEWLTTLAPSERQTLAALWRVAPGAGLAAALTDPAVIERMLAELRPADRAALERVQAEGGSIAASLLEREYGGVRPHAGFVNPRAYLNALQGVPSPVERLFVLGLLWRERGDGGLFYAVPAEWLRLLPAVPPLDRTPRLAPVGPPERIEAADPFVFERGLVNLLALAYGEPLLLNNNGTLHRGVLARLAERLDVLPAPNEARWPEAGLLRMVARDLGLLHERGGALRVSPAALDWLALEPARRVRSLFDAWLSSPFDELTALAQLRWRTPPLHRPQRAARRAALDVLGAAPPDAWVASEAIVAEMRRTNPDFARSGGDFDAWQLSAPDGAPLAGWAHWPEVEGALLRAYLAGPLHWLGLVDLGGSDESPAGGSPAVRLSAWGVALLGGGDPPPVAEDGLAVAADGSLRLSPAVPPTPRFQVNRIAAWREADPVGNEHYRLTSRSFDEALERGIGRAQIIEFLGRWARGRSWPRVVIQLEALLRDWEERRGALRGRPAILLESDDPELMRAIAADRSLDLPAHAALSPTVWAFEHADGPLAIERLRDRGYGLAAPFDDPDLPLGERDLRVLLTAALVTAGLGNARSIDTGVSGALLDRVRRLLPSAARAEAERAARDILEGREGGGWLPPREA